MNEDRILCVSNAYEKKYYLGEAFRGLPQAVKDELQVACTIFTEHVGGVLWLSFDDDENLYLHTMADDADITYDEIGAGLMIKQFQKEKRELLESLERYWNEWVNA